ncbi:MAG: hypothetical protein HQL20_10460 [Candidatus Omnitrophica bacterium]|nr:hypothetical protein [Candidatus Omnitrophota bacterium]
MDIPESISNSAVDNHQIKKGTIIKLKYRFSSGNDRFKFFVVLNKISRPDPLVCVITTSQISFYLKNAQFNADVLTIAPNAVPCFVKDTVVDCRQIYRLSMVSIRDSFSKGDMTFEGDLPETLVEKIDAVIRGSRLISPLDKKQILF